MHKRARHHVKNGGSFWMMINPYLQKKGETRKPTNRTKKWVKSWTCRGKLVIHSFSMSDF